MASKKEERERLRQERLASQQTRGSSDRRRLILGYVVAGLLTVAVIGGLVAVIAGGGDDGPDGGDCPSESNVQINSGVLDGNECDTREGTEAPEIQFGDLEESATQAGCELHLELPDDGNTHFEDETKGSYKTNPPTSGDHFASPTESGSGAIADGSYRSTPVESRAVHSMEHGRVEIRYSPDLPEEEQLALKGVIDENPDGVLLFPDDDLPYAVAVSAWTNYVGCKEYDPLVLDVARNFRDTYRGNGPEPVPITTG
jgi:hypothetical protein